MKTTTPHPLASHTLRPCYGAAGCLPRVQISDLPVRNGVCEIFACSTDWYRGGCDAGAEANAIGCDNLIVEMSPSQAIKELLERPDVCKVVCYSATDHEDYMTERLRFGGGLVRASYWTIRDGQIRLNA